MPVFVERTHEVVDLSKVSGGLAEVYTLLKDMRFCIIRSVLCLIWLLVLVPVFQQTILPSSNYDTGVRPIHYCKCRHS